jgi:hypothetical protein
MTYHPRGRYTSAKWWSKAPWIDFHTFQSGHRRYGQRMGNADYPIPDNTEEDIDIAAAAISAALKQFRRFVRR